MRAEVLVKDDGALHDYRIDRGVIRDKAPGSLTLRERDATVVTIAVAPNASISINGRSTSFSALRRGMVATRHPRRRFPGRRGSRRRQMSAATPGAQLLLVEDEESIGSLVSAYLEQSGYRIAWARSGEDALLDLDRIRPRLVILDVGLPGQDGFDVCRGIRARSSVPIVMLTARDEEVDRVAGLEVGADDYVTKPFSPRELAARVKAVLRRTEPAPQPARLELGDVVGRRRGARGHRRRRGRRADRQGVRPARLPARECRDRRLARPAARPRLGPLLRRRHADGRRPRRAAPPEARPTGRDPHLPRGGLQGRQAVTLRARLFAAIGLVALLSLVLALAIGAILTRRAVERNTLRDVSAQFDLLVEREREAILPFSRLKSLQVFLERQDERVVQVPLDGSSPLLPPERAAELRRGARLDGTLESDGTRYLYAARLVQRQGLRAPAAGELDELRLAAARRGPDHRRARRPRRSRR